jgi:hypothetical protein
MLNRVSFALLLAGATGAWAQQVISAHSGVIHYVEGQVMLDGKAVQMKPTEFPDVKNGSTLAAEDGRAEVLLTPGVILRIGENSSFKMISNSRSDTQLEILTGAAIVEVGELLPSNAITLRFHETRMELTKRGLYRLDADGNGRFRVYDGEARVTEGTQTLATRKGRQVLLAAVLDMNAFDVKDTDELMRWASRRSEYLAQANISSARAAGSSGYTNGNLGGMYGNGFGYGGAWAYNPWFGMFTYLPFGNGMYYSPFGYPYYSPYNVGYAMPTYTTSSAYPVSSTSPHYIGAGSGGYTPRPSTPAPGSGSGSYNGAVSRVGSVSSGSGSTGSTGFSGGSRAGGGAPSSGAGGGGRK